MDLPRPAMRLSIGRPIVLLTSACLTFAACAVQPPTSAAPTGERLQVVASTTVFADLVQQVAGDRVQVVALVPKGGEVHTFDPTPSDVRAVAEADLVVLNGLGLDEWVKEIVADSGASAEVLALAEDLPGAEYIDGEAQATEQDAEHSEEPKAQTDEEHGHDEVNPHLWLDVGYAKAYVERIKEALIAADPEGASSYRDDTARYTTTLDVLDAWTRERFAAIPPRDRVVVSFHEALPYLARAYGLKIAGTIVDAPGQDPSAGEIAELVQAIKQSGAKAVFGEVQFSPDLVETVAGEAGVVVESDLYTDSLGDPPVDTYEGMMRWTVERMAIALGG